MNTELNFSGPKLEHASNINVNKYFSNLLKAIFLMLVTFYVILYTFDIALEHKNGKKF